MIVVRASMRVAIAAALVLAPRALASAQTVWVEAGQERGQGVLRPRGTDCFVLTPVHVVGAEPRPVTIVGQEATRGVAELVREFPEDIAVLRLTEKGSLTCPTPPAVDVEAKLQGRANGHLEVREEDGSRTLIPVQLRSLDSEAVFIQPSAGDEIQRSMSGASLLVDGAVVGLLLTVKDGVGRVYQFDDIMRLAQPFFGGPGSGAVAGTLDVAAAQAQLDRALKTRDGSIQGQSAAVATLLASSHQFNNVNWSGISLRGAALARGVFRTAVMHLIDLSKADAQGADFSGSGLRFATLDDAVFTKAKLTEGYLPFMSAPRVKFDGADLSRSNFFGSDLRGARFDGATLIGTSFAFTDLRGASFDGANLTGAYLDGAITDATTSFKGAIFDQTSVVGAALAAVTLSDAQRSGVCRHAIDFRPSPGWIEWIVTLTERWASPRFPSGFEADQVFRSDNGFTHFTDRWMPACKTKPDVAVAYDARFPATEQLVLDRALLRVGGRAAELERRVALRLSESKTLLGPDRNLQPSAQQQAQWTAHFKQAGGRPPTTTVPYVDADSVLLLALADKVVTLEQIDWAAQAENRRTWEQAPPHTRREQPLRSMWLPFFPPEAPWHLVGTQAVDAYQRWALERSKKAPRALRVQMELQGWREGGATYPVKLRDWRSGGTGNAEEIARFLNSEERYSERLFYTRALALSTVHTPDGNDRKARGGVFVLPGSIYQQGIVLPGELMREPAVLEVELIVEKVQPIPSAMLVFAKPGLARLLRGDKEIWRGAVTTVEGAAQ